VQLESSACHGLKPRFANQNPRGNCATWAPLNLCHLEVGRHHTPARMRAHMATDHTVLDRCDQAEVFVTTMDLWPRQGRATTRVESAPGHVWVRLDESTTWQSRPVIVIRLKIREIICIRLVKLMRSLKGRCHDRTLSQTDRPFAWRAHGQACKAAHAGHLDTAEKHQLFPCALRAVISDRNTCAFRARGRVPEHVPCPASGPADTRSDGRSSDLCIDARRVSGIQKVQMSWARR
jgi:hypothetical protein